jgi:hypothetical protein
MNGEKSPKVCLRAAGDAWNISAVARLPEQKAMRRS